MAGLFFRLLFKALMPVLLLLGGLAYFGYLQGHDPLNMLLKPFGGAASFSLDGLQRSAESLKEKADQAVEGARTVYRWRDADGHRYYGEHPPAGALGVTALQIDPNVNVISAFRDPAAVAAEPEASSEAATLTGPAADDGLPNPYSPAQIKQLFEDARGLRETLEAQQKTREELFKQLN